MRGGQRVREWSRAEVWVGVSRVTEKGGRGGQMRGGKKR